MLFGHGLYVATSQIALVYLHSFHSASRRCRAVMHIENGTQASFNKMTFTSNHGELALLPPPYSKLRVIKKLCQDWRHSSSLRCASL